MDKARDPSKGKAKLIGLRRFFLPFSIEEANFFSNSNHEPSFPTVCVSRKDLLSKTPKINELKVRSEWLAASEAYYWKVNRSLQTLCPASPYKAIYESSFLSVPEK